MRAFATPALFSLATILLYLPASAQTPSVVRYRQWVAGQELGGAEDRTSIESVGTKIEHREWINFTRLGIEIQQEIQETATRGADGSLHFTWRTLLSKEPMEGEATWSPSKPKEMRVQAKGFEIKIIPMQPGTVLWPGDIEAKLKDAARFQKPLKITSYSFATQQWTALDLKPTGPSPVPGFPDAVRFKGEEMDGANRTETEVWISPSRGDLKHSGEMMGLSLVLQRAELPPPTGGGHNAEAFFEQSLKVIPEHPFQPWLPEITVRWEGAKPLALPEDPQQHQLRENLFRLRRAAPPTLDEAREKPYTGKPAKDDVPFLAATPLVQFNDPAFDGLIFRMRLAQGASRWDLAKAVTDFVWEWITEKDYTVGFASALEVCRNPRGDCTEHGVLTVALLRKLGVPARGVVGWVAAGGNLGLHFWVEVKLKHRWVPVDPTFDQVPASAFRLKLGTTDLADLGSVGWEGAGQVFGGGNWIVEKPESGGDIRIEGDALRAPDGTRLRYPGGIWALESGAVFLKIKGQDITVSAQPRPYAAMLKSAQLFQGNAGKGWWVAAEKRVWVDLGRQHWMTFSATDQGIATSILDHLSVEIPAQ